MTTADTEVVNGPDRARLGCFVGCARAPSNFRSRVYADSKLLYGISSPSED